jgi:hypothetical protein
VLADHISEGRQRDPLCEVQLHLKQVRGGAVRRGSEAGQWGSEAVRQ